MPLILGGGAATPSPGGAQGPLLPGTITGVNPTLCLVDGAATPINVLTGHPYYPLVGDRVALVRFGSNYLAQPVDFQASFNPPDDRWHGVGDLGEPAFLDNAVPFVLTPNDGGVEFGDTVRFTRDPAGMVWIEGLVTVGNGNDGVRIFQLPPGYRPAYQLCFTTAHANGVAQIGVDPDGTVYVQQNPGTAATWCSLDSVSFMSEDGPNGPTWTDLADYINAAGGWVAAYGSFVSTYSGATGAPYQGARMCIDAAGDVHLSGMVSHVGGGQTTTPYLSGLSATGSPLAGQIDTDDAQRTWLTACAGTVGFARQDVFADKIQNTTYAGNTSGNSGWVSLDMCHWPGGNNPTRWAATGYLNSWTPYGGTWAGLGARMSRFGTVYLRGLVKGTANTICAANPGWESGGYNAPNVHKVWAAMCGATAGAGANRTDVQLGGLKAGVALFTGQTAGSATTGFTTFSGMRWSTRRYSA